VLLTLNETLQRVQAGQPVDVAASAPAELAA
jgi:hypothetical protein